jgi:hypothetical protein
MNQNCHREITLRVITVIACNGIHDGEVSHAPILGIEMRVGTDRIEMDAIEMELSLN